MPSSVIYLGPSLKLEDARNILNAEYLPPIKRGDVGELLRTQKPDAIGIVDGRFLQSFSISPKEILKAMDAGVKVYGSSSMGALRAVELAPYGMVGVGQIFRLFASEELDADDEVAMVYDSQTLRPTSDPLVNMRIAFKAAADQGIISEETRALLVNEAKKIYFPERNYKYVLSRLINEIPEDETANLKQFLGTNPPDAKREDAIELLHQMNSYLTSL